MPYNSSPITTMEALQREQFITRERLKVRKQTLQNKMQQLPGELAAAGVNNFIPKFLRGKVSNAALNGGKKLINSYFAPENAGTRKLVGGTVKKFNLLSGLKSIFKIVRGR